MICVLVKNHLIEPAVFQGKALINGVYKIIYHICIIYSIFTFSNLSVADIHYYLTHIDDKIHVRGEFSKYNKQDPIELFVPGTIFGTDYTKQIKNITILDGNYNPANLTATLNQDSNLTIEYDYSKLV